MATDQTEPTVLRAHDSAVREFMESQRSPEQLSNREIVSEVRDLHARFEQLSKQFEQAAPGQRAEIREEMQPIVIREKELREEYGGRLNQQELVRDQMPAQKAAITY